MARPESILTYLRDEGFERPVVNMLDSVFRMDRRRFILAMTCAEEELDAHVDAIADHCLLNRAAVYSIATSIRSVAIIAGVESSDHLKNKGAYSSSNHVSSNIELNVSEGVETNTTSCMDNQLSDISAESFVSDYPYRGGLYTGLLSDSVPQGKGILRYSDGSYYDGDFIDGMRVGRGIFHWMNGNWYRGGLSR